MQNVNVSVRTLVAILSMCAAACSQTSPSPAMSDTSSGSPTATANAGGNLVLGVPYDRLVGQWQFVYDDARRATVESQLASKISDPKELAQAKHDAEEEAGASTIEFTLDRFYVSRIGTKEIMRGACDQAPPGVTLTLRDDRTLVMHDPQKGDLIFARR